jgi:predicted 2-oxoglutarate/Fe(II)-dependent dioxygenase YbiX
MKPIEIKNFLTIEECNLILEMTNNIEFTNATTTYTDKKDINNENLKFNKRKIKYIESKELPELTDKILNEINKLKLFNGIKYTEITSYSFNKYSDNDFLNYHIDSAEINIGGTITIILELCDDYKGGEFCYMLDNIEYTFEKGKGSLYLFESTTMHKVKPITNGVRYSINCWPIYQSKKTLL